MAERKIYTSVIIKALATASTAYGECSTGNWPGALTMFTHLSNIFSLAAIIISLIYDILIIKGKIGEKPQAVHILKFMSAVSVMITFLVFLILLAPVYPGGFISAYTANNCASLCLHIISPLLALTDFLLFERGYISKKRHAVYAVIPPLFYLGYIIVLHKCFGVVWYDKCAAPYNFLNYEAPTGWFGFDMSVRDYTTIGIGVAYVIPVLVLLFMGLGALMLSIRKKICR